MTPVTLALVLSAAAIHAAWNLWAKQLGPGVRSGPLMWLLTGISSVAYAPIALWTLEHSNWRPSPAAIGLVVGSGAIHVVYFLLLLRGYRVGDLSLVYPVARGTGPLLSFAGALLLLGDRASVASVSGALLIATGVLVLTWRTGEAAKAPLATGLAIAAYTLWDGWSVQRAGIPPLVFYWGGEVTRVLLFSPSAARDPAGVAAIWREHRARAVGIALLSPLSYILVLIALRTGSLSHIAPAREISILIGAWLGGRVLGERDRARRLLAAAAFAAGVIALALAKG